MKSSSKSQKKSVAIIGATGIIGREISKCLATGHYRLLLMDEEPEAIQILALQLRQTTSSAEVEVMICAREASWEADIIILATSPDMNHQLADRIREVTVGKIVVIISQPTQESITTIRYTHSAAEELQQLLPNARVVKTFNTSYALRQFTASANHQKPDAFIAGNNGDAVDVVSGLIANAGFIPVPVGDLSMSRTLERMQFSIIQESRKQSGFLVNEL